MNDDVDDDCDYLTLPDDDMIIITVFLAA